MGGRISLGKAALLRWRTSRRVMEATISVWFPTLWEVTLHSMPASLLVRIVSNNHSISLLKVYFLCTQSLRYVTLIVSCTRSLIGYPWASALGLNYRN